LGGQPGLATVRSEGTEIRQKALKIAAFNPGHAHVSRTGPAGFRSGATRLWLDRWRSRNTCAFI